MPYQSPEPFNSFSAIPDHGHSQPSCRGVLRSGLPDVPLATSPIREQGDHSAQPQAREVVGHVVGPLRVLDDGVVCRVLDDEAPGAESGGHGVERGKVEVFEVSHRPGQVDTVDARARGHHAWCNRGAGPLNRRSIGP